jgi:hypothetical protein
MEQPTLTEFYLASAGAGGAFVGLLFVAISIGPQRTFGSSADGAPRQHLAEGALLTLVNGFLVSSFGLIPGRSVGWAALLLGIGGVLTAAHLVWLFAHFHRHGSMRRIPSLHLLRTTGISVVAIIVGLIESVLGLRFIMEPTDDLLRGLAFVIITLYALGILRAWILLGDPQQGWSGWINPLQNDGMVEVVDATSAEVSPSSGRLVIRRQRRVVFVESTGAAKDAPDWKSGAKTTKSLRDQ